MLACLCVGGLALAVALIAPTPSNGEETTNVTAADTVEFGTNTSDGARDGSCSDLRFENDPSSATAGMARVPVADDIFRDASDCYRAFVANTIRLRTTVDGIDFGADQGPRDYTCHDPRLAPLEWTGERGGGAEPARAGTDASDCWLAYLSEEVGQYSEMFGIVFGNDRGKWANDEECDDPRFRNVAGVPQSLMSDSLVRNSVGRDASDCLNAMTARAIELRPNDDIDGIMFGDDSSRWAFDHQCDDARFEAVDPLPSDADIFMSSFLSATSVGRDATDCRGGYDQGSIALTEVTPLDDISFGDNASDYAYDGECDDPRFADVSSASGEESRMSSQLHLADWGHDAIDCFRAYRDERIQINVDK